MSKHTPGPLHVEHAKATHEGGHYFIVTGADCITVPDGQVLASTSDDLDEDKANADLFAAAPDMLGAIDRAIGNAYQDEHGDWIVSREHLLLLNAAIAKAKGE